MRSEWPLVLLVLWLMTRGESQAAAPGRVHDWTDDEMRAFVDMVQGMSIDPAIVLSVYHFESGLNPQAVNPVTQAQGIPQFLPSTLAKMGYTGDPTAFHTLGVMGQLPWIGQLLASQVQQLGAPPDSAAKLLHLNLWPATAKASVVFTRGTSGYEANAKLDTQGRGFVDEDDLARVLAASDAQASYSAALSQMRRV